MIGKGIEGKRLVSSAEVYEILEDRKKDSDLGYEQKLTYEYLDNVKKVIKLSAEHAKKMKKELEEIGLSEKVAIKIADIVPLNMDQLKQILVLEKKAVEEDVAKKALEIVEKFRGK